MKKGMFSRENIEKLVRLVPRPTMNGKLIARSRNFWLILQEYGEQEGIEILNQITNHGGKIPYDSMREWREPDMVILLAQLNLGKDGIFELTPFLDGPEAEMIIEEEDILPERLAYVRTTLDSCTVEQKAVLKEILIKQPMEHGEVMASCSRHGIANGSNFVAVLNGRTSLLDVGDRQKVSIKSALLPAVQRVLFPPKTDSVTTSSQPLQSS
jgi:hypothetical protein